MNKGAKGFIISFILLSALACRFILIQSCYVPSSSRKIVIASAIAFSKGSPLMSLRSKLPGLSSEASSSNWQFLSLLTHQLWCSSGLFFQDQVLQRQRIPPWSKSSTESLLTPLSTVSSSWGSLCTMSLMVQVKNCLFSYCHRTSTSSKHRRMVYCRQMALQCWLSTRNFNRLPSAQILRIHSDCFQQRLPSGAHSL